MKTVNSVKISIKGSETNVFVKDGSVFIETKKGALPVSFVNKASKKIWFKDGDKEISAEFTGSVETVNALFSATAKGCELVSFESYKQYLSERSEKIGSDFDADKVVCAYKYL